MSASALRSAAVAAVAAARRLRPRLLSTKTPANEEESIRRTTAHVGRELKKLKADMLFHGKLHRALQVVATPVVIYLAIKIYSQSCEIESLQKRAEALREDEA